MQNHDARGRTDGRTRLESFESCDDVDDDHDDHVMEIVLHASIDVAAHV
jgi:hypothetical protein